MKKILIIVGVLVVLVIIALTLLVSNLGPVIKTAVETVGPELTKTKVKLESADVSIFSGTVDLGGFLLGNPAGFTAPTAMTCKSIEVDIDNSSVTTDTIIIKKIEIIAPVITYEKKGSTDNFQTIQQNVQKAVPAGDGSAAKTETADSGQSKKIIIENFIVKDAKINLAGSILSTLGGNEGVGIDLPDIHIKDIGKDKDTSPAEAFAQILKEMTSGVGTSVTGFTKEIGAQAQKAVEAVTKQAGDVTKSVQDQAGSVTDKVKGLFGND